MEKPCHKCSQLKPLSDFYPHWSTKDGFEHVCKLCKKIQAVTRLGNKTETDRRKVRASEKQPLSDDARFRKIRYRAYRKEILENLRNYYYQNPEKVKAHSLVRRALEKGDLNKEPCFICGSIINVEAHHSNYAEPLNVIWLCRRHHQFHHQGKLSLLLPKQKK